MATKKEVKEILVEVLREHKVDSPSDVANDQIDLLSDTIEFDEEDEDFSEDEE